MTTTSPLSPQCACTPVQYVRPRNLADRAAMRRDRKTQPRLHADLLRKRNRRYSRFAVYLIPSYVVQLCVRLEVRATRRSRATDTRVSLDGSWPHFVRSRTTYAYFSHRKELSGYLLLVLPLRRVTALRHSKAHTLGILRATRPPASRRCTPSHLPSRQESFQMLQDS